MLHLKYRSEFPKAVSPSLALEFSAKKYDGQAFRVSWDPGKILLVAKFDFQMHSASICFSWKGVVIL